MTKAERVELVERMAAKLRGFLLGDLQGNEIVISERQAAVLADHALAAIEKSKTRLVYYPEDTEQ